MKFIIIGASGQVGNALLRALRDRNHQVVGIDNLQLSPNIIKADASDVAKMNYIINREEPDWVFYAAGYSWVDGCELEPNLSYQSNVESPLAIASIIGNLDSKFLYFSSEYVFDGLQGPYTEESTPNPINVYGHHKLEAEQRLPSVVRALIIRTTVVYGVENQRKNFACQILDNSRANKVIFVPTDQISSPTYNMDLAAACVELAEHGITGTLNLAGPDRLDRYSFALEVCKAFDIDTKWISPQATTVLGQVALRPLNGGLDSRKAYHLLQTKFHNVQEGLRKMRSLLEEHVSVVGE